MQFDNCLYTLDADKNKTKQNKQNKQTNKLILNCNLNVTGVRDIYILTKLYPNL